MSSIFTKIIQGEIPCYKLAEDENFLAFLDVRPLSKGHTLVIPKTEVDYIFDIDSQLYKELFIFAKTVAQALKKAIPCKRIGIAVIGLEVPHAHIHLVPMNEIGDLNFEKERLQFTHLAFQEVADQIIRHM